MQEQQRHREPRLDRFVTRMRALHDASAPRDDGIALEPCPYMRLIPTAY
jgi:hypothetical protein